MSARKLALLVLVVFAGLLAFASAPALAAAPEAPLTEPATGVTADSATLHGVLNPGAPGEAGSYEFLYRASASECQGAGEEKFGGSALGKEKEAAFAEVGGLLPNTEYAFCLLVRNEAGETAVGSPQAFTTLSREPGVSGEAVSGIGSVSATVSAQIDAGGLETTYRVQYGTTTGYGAETATGSMSPGTRTISVPLTGLEANTEYHFRLVVSNADGTQVGSDTVFTTYPTGISGLPDGRVPEMVSPPENHDAQVYVPGPVYSFGYYTFLPFQASSDGDKVVYESDPTTGGDGNTGFLFGNAQLASRGRDGGWIQTPVQPPGYEFGDEESYQAFSPDLEEGIFGTCLQPVLASGAPTVPGVRLGYNLLYERNNVSGSWSSLFTVTPPNREPQQVGAEIVRFGAGVVQFSLGVTLHCERPLVYAGASGDFSRLLFEANDSLLEGGGKLAMELTEDVKREIAEERDSNNLYVSSASGVELVNVLPDGKADPNASFGGQASGLGNFSHVFSADGSRIFWTDLNTGVVYVRENGTRTVPVSEGSASYLTASNDGRYVFYAEGEKLYRFDVDNEAREVLAGAGAGVQGVVGSSEDGERLYFVADGALSPDAGAGDSNLYEWHAGTTSFIATLGGGDAQDWSAAMGTRDAQVTSDGRAVVFMSERSLTGYPTEGQKEVYVYESEDGAGAPGVFCGSCVPRGVSGASGFLALSWSNTYAQRSISSDGSLVFFDSYAALVPQDTDGNADVYEWERDGSGSCDLPAGCVYLLSGGANPAALVDASASGNDVFFVTTGQLLPQDGNEAIDLYDARVGGVSVVQTACSGTGCQGPPAPAPVFATPASVTFNGVGNFSPPSTTPVVSTKAKPLTRKQKLARALRECHKKHHGKQRAVCEARARKRYRAAAKTTKSATRKGR